MLGIPRSLPIAREQQADCLAGAMIGDAIDADVLVLEDGDVTELVNGLRSVADDPDVPWFDPQAHGTADQRIRAFSTGYSGSIDTCVAGW